jgi:hypothetical protein
MPKLDTKRVFIGQSKTNSSTAGSLLLSKYYSINTDWLVKITNYVALVISGNTLYVTYVGLLLPEDTHTHTLTRSSRLRTIASRGIYPDRDIYVADTRLYTTLLWRSRNTVRI